MDEAGSHDLLIEIVGQDLGADALVSVRDDAGRGCRRPPPAPRSRGARTGSGWERSPAPGVELRPGYGLAIESAEGEGTECG